MGQDRPYCSAKILNGTLPRLPIPDVRLPPGRRAPDAGQCSPAAASYFGLGRLDGIVKDPYKSRVVRPVSLLICSGPDPTHRDANTRR